MCDKYQISVATHRTASFNTQFKINLFRLVIIVVDEIVCSILQYDGWSTIHVHSISETVVRLSNLFALFIHIYCTSDEFQMY